MTLLKESPQHDVRMQEIVFSASSNGDEDIYIMDCHGNMLHRLTWSSAPGITNRTPEWSPDRSKIAFQSNRDGASGLYIVTIASGEVRRITAPSGASYRHPAWSPLGDKIICVAERTSSVLTVINIEDSSEKCIIPSGTEGRNLFNPSWIPGGNQIAFVLQGNTGEADALWTCDIDGSNSERVGPEELSIFEFDYSPDGQSIIFDAKVSATSPLGEWDIFVMTADGSAVRRLTDGLAMSSRPKWMRDGKTLVFHTNRFGNKLEQPSADAPLEDWFVWWNQFEICTMQADGSNLRRLTLNQLRDLHPDA